MIFFMHIPRTGGVAFTGTLKEFYRVWQISEGVLAYLPGMRQRGELRDLECVAGHIPHGFHHCFPPPVHYITLLRDPVERLVSTYYFFKNRQGWKGQNLLFQDMALQYDLVKFARQRYASLDNSQVRYMAGMQVSGLINKAVTRHDCKRAIKQMDAFTGVGVLEMLDKSLRLFAENLDWPYIPKMGVSNSAARDGPVDEATAAEIRALNRFDQRLYEEACERLERCIK